jgi:hypothetical protein
MFLDSEFAIKGHLGVDVMSGYLILKLETGYLLENNKFLIKICLYDTVRNIFVKKEHGDILLGKLADIEKDKLFVTCLAEVKEIMRKYINELPDVEARAAVILTSTLENKFSDMFKIVFDN